MLLPSALSCDSSHRNAPSRFQTTSAALFTSPPTSPIPNASSTLFATCRALQQMLSSPSPAPPSQLPTPPMSHTSFAPPASPVKLRLRSRKPADDSNNDDISAPRMRTRRITKRNAPPPRGINKRRRAIDDDASRDAPDSDNDDVQLRPADEMAGPSTPKRIRLAPQVLPMGLERSDFQRLEEMAEENASVDERRKEGEGEATNEEWSSVEDRLLVELVLEKLKLSKSDWQDCARSLGKDRGSVGRRWKSLVGSGEVGLKNSRGRRERGRIHATWR